MKCPKCGSKKVRKNGHRAGKQNYLCKDCQRQFVEFYSPRGYSDDARQICLKMRSEGMGFREIERITGISHNTIINWAKETELLPPEDGEDEGEVLEVCAIARSRF